jgi:hypothetical protein
MRHRLALELMKQVLGTSLSLVIIQTNCEEAS